MSVVSFPTQGRRESEIVEVERCVETATGRALYIFEIIDKDGQRLGIAFRDAIAEAQADAAWFRQQGLTIVEIGRPFDEVSR